MDLVLAVKREYFDQIKTGEKTEEFRLYNEYWINRIINKKKSYNRVVITLGYPNKEDFSRRLTFPYIGYTIKEISHKHFGDDPVKVFAIKLT
jgi:hypothetical protein